MAAFELLLSQGRRHCLTSSPSRLHLLLGPKKPSFLLLHRSLCSSSPSSKSNLESNSETDESNSQFLKRPQPVPIQPVSYPMKPKDSSESQSQEATSPSSQSEPRPRQPDFNSRDTISSETRSWTRQDFRYVKDVPTITPVSYPARVAPLPDDKVEVVAEEKEKEKKEGEGELEKEWRKIESDSRIARRIFRVEEEKVPFPTLIKEESNKKEKVIYDLKEAIKLVKANSKRNFDETLEAHVKLATELRRSDLAVSGSVNLTHGTGRACRLAVFAEGGAADEARAAGAEIVGGKELVDEIKNGNIKVNFDKCFATPEMVSHLTKISKYLKRLMPKANDGTVTNDISRAVKESKKIISFKKDRTAIVHVGLGKVSLSEEALRENVGAFVNALLQAKPAGLKKSSKYAGYVSTFHICSSMGPSFSVSIQSLSLAADHHNRLQVR